MLVFLFIAMLAWNTRWRWWVTLPALLYPIVQSIAVVYTANHYVTDLIIGGIYAVGGRVRRPAALAPAGAARMSGTLVAAAAAPEPPARGRRPRAGRVAALSADRVRR